ncbi:hypothetical protein [Anabaena subtropica]|nr:hypothetical protein [Anabaena subtropica]
MLQVEDLEKGLGIIYKLPAFLAFIAKDAKSQVQYYYAGKNAKPQ